MVFVTPHICYFEYAYHCCVEAFLFVKIAEGSRDDNAKKYTNKGSRDDKKYEGRPYILLLTLWLLVPKLEYRHHIFVWGVVTHAR